MSAVTSQSVDVLIVTDNFVEAADLTEALGAIEMDRVMHLRNAEECRPFLADPVFRPWLSMVSYRREMRSIKELANALVARGSELILIDAAEEDARALRGVALTRPFSSETLHALLSDMRNRTRPDRPTPEPM